MIRCLLKINFAGSIHGYDLNPISCKVAQSKIEHYHLKHQCIIRSERFLSYLPAGANYLIFNPTYLHAPDHSLYIPSLNGRTDGATIAKKLLSIGFDGAILMISAYSNPIETVEYEIAQSYQTIDLMVTPLKFGYYSCEPKVKQAIEELRKNRKAFYSQNTYFLAGVLFRQKKVSSVDLSTEFLKVMTVL